MPGEQINYSEVLWRDPLAQIQKGKSYKISRFELRECLIRHETYATYRALDSQLDRPVIVKVLLPQHAVTYLGDGPDRQKLFEQLRSIGHHPRIS